MRHPSRRALLAGFAATGLLPMRTLRAGSDDEGLFIFVFCSGGWDQAKVFAPVFDGNFTPEESAQPASAHGIDFVDHPLRPAVRTFFEDFGDRACLLNGFEVQSVSHAGCTRRVFTANTDDDWASRIAAAGADRLMPHVLVSGPGFTRETTAKVVRVGETGQLGPLLDGSALESSELPTSGLETAAADSVDAYLRERSEKLARFDGAYHDRLADLEWLLAASDSLSSSGNKLASLTERLALALDALEQGLARCATAEFLGLNEMGWDQHSDLSVQDIHFQMLFEDLHELVQDLDRRGLAERTTVVVFSEMGRNPVLNSNGGKHHWTFTSALLLGSGVAGGRTIGGWDENCMGLPIDPDTGGPGSRGLVSEDFGATLMALAGLEAPKGVPIRAVLA